MKNLITVIMCTYNEKQKELEQAIQSILGQTYSYFELIIVLDNPDNQMIQDVVYQYAKTDKRIRVIANKKNIGVAKSSNRAWKAAKGEYIAKMDADDIAAPQRLELEWKILSEKNLDFIAASKRNINENGENKGEFVNALNISQLKQLLPCDNLVNQSTVLMKKSVLEELGGYMNLPSCEDYDLWLRMLCRGYKMEIIPDILVDYRVRENSITRNDYYKQYLSDCFVRSMYRSHKRGSELWTIRDFHHYLQYRKPSEKKRLRFNHAYSLYYQGMEERKTGRYGKALIYILAGILQNPNVLVLFVRKLIFHIRKRIIIKLGR